MVLQGMDHGKDQYIIPSCFGIPLLDRLCTISKHKILKNIKSFSDFVPSDHIIQLGLKSQSPDTDLFSIRKV